MIDKSLLRQQIVDNLTVDLNIAMQAAHVAHAAAICTETQPDNKYDTLSLESSYIAQGHANRGQQIRKSLQVYNSLVLRFFSEDTPIAMSAVVEIEFENRSKKIVFIAPAAGGMRVNCAGIIVNVITLESPLAKALLGRNVGDMFSFGDNDGQNGEIISLW